MNHSIFRLLIFSPAPSAPQSVSASSVNSTAVMVTWKEPKNPNGLVTWYEIHFKRSVSDVVSTRLFSANHMPAREVVIGDLAPYSFYVFNVRAATGQQHKLWGNFTTAKERTGEAGVFLMIIYCIIWTRVFYRF